MRNKLFILLVIVITFTSVNVFALESCTTNEMNRLKELAQNVQFKTSYEIDTINEEEKLIYGLYDIQIVNFDKDLRITYNLLRSDINNESEEEIELLSDQNKIEDIPEGNTIVANIYAYSANLCSGKLLKTTSIKLPYYNDYYYFNKEKCQANPEFSYCKEFSNEDFTESYEDVDLKFDEYLKGEDKENNNSKLNKNLYFIIGGVSILLILSIVIIIIVKKKNKKDDI